MMDGHKTSTPANPQEQPPQRQLPTSLQLHIASLLTPNDRALSGRFACRDAADALSGPQHCTASLSQPLPPHAVCWAKEAGQQHVRQLPFQHKFHLLSTAACSGSEVNLEVAWALLEPSVFQEVLQNKRWGRDPYPDPDVVAVTAGHVHLLGWLLRRCPGLIQPDEVLGAAALHHPLAELQQAWNALRGHLNKGNSSSSSNGDIPNNGSCTSPSRCWTQLPSRAPQTLWPRWSGCWLKARAAACCGTALPGLRPALGTWAGCGGCGAAAAHLGSSLLPRSEGRSLYGIGTSQPAGCAAAVARGVVRAAATGKGGRGQQQQLDGLYARCCHRP